jgi:NAD(P)-dependent dehydrogenase (short-subunit alcohol dehydrogenase family)
VNIASIAGLVGERTLGAYAASKGGVVQLTRVLALEGARDRVRANAICPVFTATPMLEAYAAASSDPEAAMRHILRGIPLRRVGAPEDVAYAALYLVSDEASFITGVAFPVDGGATAQ